VALGIVMLAAPMGLKAQKGPQGQKPRTAQQRSTAQRGSTQEQLEHVKNTVDDEYKRKNRATRYKDKQRIN
jgi:hypothetical protein